MQFLCVTKVYRSLNLWLQRYILMTRTLVTGSENFHPETMDSSHLLHWAGFQPNTVGLKTNFPG